MVYEKKKIKWLSPSGVSALDRCPRCFWLRYNKKIYQPEGIKSRLANRFDIILKKYFDLYRQNGELPPFLEGKVEGVLENPFKETYFYRYDEDYGYMGKLDDCLVTSQGLYTPIDHKTSSSDPREKGIFPAYQYQMDSYAWLLEENRKKTTGISHLIFYYPDHTEDFHNGCKIIKHIQTLDTKPQRAKDRFLAAREVLKNPMPASAEDCEFCLWRETVNKEVDG